MINDLDEVSYAYLLAPTFQFVNTNGKPITGGWMEVYIHGTRNKYYCASDFDGTLHPFKIPLDSLGSNIVLASPAFAYDVYVYNRFGTLLMSRYNVIPVNGGCATGVVPATIVVDSSDGTVDITVEGNVYNLSIQDTINKIDNVSATLSNEITTQVTNLGNTLNNTITNVSGDLYDLIEEVSGSAHEQVQSNWEEDDSTQPSYIQNKPDKLNIVAGDNINIAEIGDNLVISASGGDLSNYATHSEVNSVSGAIINVVSNVSSTLNGNIDTASGNLVQTISNVSGILENEISSIPEQVNADWNATSGKAEILNRPNVKGLVAGENINIVASGDNYVINASGGDLSNYVTHSELSGSLNVVSGNLTNYVNNVSGNLVNYTNSVSGNISNNISNVSGNLVNYTNTASGNLVNYTNSVSGNLVNTISNVSGDLINVIETATGNIPEQVQSDWTETDTTDPSYIQNKPNKVNLVAGTNIGIATSGTNLIISASGGDLSNYATHTEVNAVSSVLEGEIQVVSAAIPQAQVQSDWTETNINDPAYIQHKPAVSGLVAGDNITITASGSNYVISGQAGGGSYQEGYGIDIANNTISVDTSVIPDVSAVQQMIATASGNDNLFIATYINTNYNDVVSAYNAGKYIVCRMKLNSTNQSYWFAPLFKYNSTNQTFYFVYTSTDTTNDPYKYKGSIEIITVKPTGSNNGWYAGVYNVNPNWNETDTQSINYIQNKPDLSVYTTQTQVSAIASAYATGGGGSGIIYHAGDYIDITNDTISVTGITELVAGNAITITSSGSSAIISSTGEAQVQSDWNVTASSSKAYIRNKPSIPAAQIQSDWNQTNTSSKDYIKNKPTIKNYTGASGVVIDNATISLDEPLGIVAGSGINIVIDGDSAIICANVTGSIPTQVNSDWNSTSGVSEILNKPTEVNLLAGSGITYTPSGNDIVINSTPTISLADLNTAGIVDIQIVNDASACTGTNIFYLIPEA